MPRCAECGEEFQPRGAGKPQRFCSKKCRETWASAHRWDSRQKKTGPCVVCRSETSSRNGVALCDNAECKSLRILAGRLISRTGEVATSIDYYSCDNCAAVFVGKVRSNRKYCTRECALRAAKRNGKHRRRTVERVGDFITITRLGERDGWVCHLCGKPIKLRSGGAAMAPSIDHLIPISAGGAHVWSNVAIAHKRCNSRRRTGGKVQLRLDT